jgi:hypothetical protein
MLSILLYLSLIFVFNVPCAISLHISVKRYTRDIHKMNVSKGILITERPESELPESELEQLKRDRLPFTMYLLKEKDGNDRKEVGTFYLDSTTSCGDFIQDKDNNEYKVRRITFVYKYSPNNKLQVVRKKMDVTAVKNPRFKNALQ